MNWKALYTTLTLVFNMAAILLLLFIILGGTFDKFPLNEFYWFQADTSDIDGAPDQTRWTLWGRCEVGSDDLNTNCTSNKPAYPFQPTDNFNTERGVPNDFRVNDSTYYYLSRFAFPFYLIGLFFTVCSLLMGTTSFLSRLGAAVSSAIAFLSFLFVAAASALITACYVMARDAFEPENEAKLGVKMFAFTWTATALTLLCMIGFCMGWHRDSTSSRLNRASSFERKSGSRKKRGFFNVGGSRYTDDDFVRGGETGSQNPVMAPVSSYERGGAA